MITAEFIFNTDECITGFKINGHSGSAVKGEDIICSAVSSSAYMTANTITEVLLLEASIHESDGNLSVELNENDAKKAQVILKGFYIHMKELSKMYPDNIKVERGAL